ncbi:MAG: site-specific integrase [Rhodomicrobium sp.]
MSDLLSGARKRQSQPQGVKPKTTAAAIALAKSQAYQDAADAPGTLKAYASDVAHFEAWCKAQGFAAEPDPTVVGAYLAAAGEGYAPSTLRRRVAAIARASGMAGHPLDTKHPAIRETLRGIGRRHGARARRSAALTTAEIRRICAACDQSLSGIRDRALVLLGFAGAFRRSELVSLNVEHIDWTRDGMTIFIERSKTDKAGEGAEIAIPHGRSEETCAVTALRTWLQASKIHRGPLFRKINKAGRIERPRLGVDAVRSILLMRARQAGLQGKWQEPISPHSLRAGFVTTAYGNGVLDEEIMRHTRHKSLATMRSYVRRSKLSTSSPAGKIGL